MRFSSVFPKHIFWETKMLAPARTRGCVQLHNGLFMHKKPNRRGRRLHNVQGAMYTFCCEFYVYIIRSSGPTIVHFLLILGPNIIHVACAQFCTYPLKQNFATLTFDGPLPKKKTWGIWLYFHYHCFCLNKCAIVGPDDRTFVCAFPSLLLCTFVMTWNYL